MENLKSKGKIVLILFAVIILIVAVFFLINSKNESQRNNIETKPVEETPVSKSNVEFAPETAEQVIPFGEIQETIEDKILFKINLGVAKDGVFSPTEIPPFKAGNRLALSLTSLDDYKHSLVFDSPALSDVVINVEPRTSKLVTFDLPKEPGVYTFHCGIEGHETETGKITIE